MTFNLPELPYNNNALEPYISQETLEYHYGKHHKAYVDKLNELITETEFANVDSLEEIIKKSSGPIFNNAAQVWNHSFYWQCLSPNFSQNPSSELLEAINNSFGSFEEFKQKFTQTAMTTFGSGWAWLVKNHQNQLEIISTSNAGTPICDNKKPLLTCDVWEHAYYIDTRNNRAKYIENFWEIVNWKFVDQQFA